MTSTFPTFERVWERCVAALSVDSPFGPGRRSAAVLRLLGVCAEVGMPAEDLLAAWARDERGAQRARVARAASLLAAGTTPADVVDAVPRLVTEEHAVAVRFGDRTGLLPQVVAATLAGDAASDDSGRSRLRAGLGYVAVVVSVFGVVSMLLAIKVIPQFQRIIQEFGMEQPAALGLSVVVSRWLAEAAFWGLLAAAMISVLMLVPPLRRWVRGLVVVPRRRPRRLATALDHLGVALAAGRSLPEAAGILAGCQVDPVVAARLRLVAAAEQGSGLGSAGLATAAEERFVAAADLTGDASWALATLARQRREALTRRVLAWGNAIVPLAAILMGAFVLLEALAVFVPLVRLIGGLA